MSTNIPNSVRDRVAAAAQQRCGYCRTSQRISGAQMHIDHIVPLAEGGTSEESNLWLACAWCNSYKGSNMRAIDPESGEGVCLFNPRKQRWSSHFTWSDDGLMVIGLTATGRATINALRLNNEYVVVARHYWVQAGWHPPGEDG